jgi:hypothetical protein
MSFHHGLVSKMLLPVSLVRHLVALAARTAVLGVEARAGSRDASDLGNIDHFTFNRDQLDGMKKTCQKHCFSTLNHNFAYCYNGARVIRWMWEKRKALIPRLRPLLDCPLSLSSKLSLGF